MVFSLVVFIASIIFMLLLILFAPYIKIGEKQIDTFYIAPMIGAIILLCYPLFDKTELVHVLFSNSKLNPLKILTLFISISFISISLDEAGFFSYIANKFITRFNKNQFALFFSLYALISILTIFTSNDIVILTFTPFILYFAKRGNINSIPYLVMEFVAANTYSAFLPIGNPTNMYLTSIFSIDFVSYVANMFTKTIIIGVSTILFLTLLFYPKLKQKIKVYETSKIKIKDKFLCTVSLIFLALSTILLVISNYINIEMWIIALSCAGMLLLITIVYSIIKRDKQVCTNPLKRIPYNLIPFILSMFIMIMCLNSFHTFYIVSQSIQKIESTKVQEIVYLISSTLSCNILNNIPMSITFGGILTNVQFLGAIYSTIIGSNIGAILSPVGSLAGIMWMRLLKNGEVKFSFMDFVKCGAFILIPTLCILSIYILIF